MTFYVALHSPPAMGPPLPWRGPGPPRTSSCGHRPPSHTGTRRAGAPVHRHTWGPRGPEPKADRGRLEERAGRATLGRGAVLSTASARACGSLGQRAQGMLFRGPWGLPTLGEL